MDRVRRDGTGADGSRGRAGEFTAAHPHGGRWYVPKQHPPTPPPPPALTPTSRSASLTTAHLTNELSAPKTNSGFRPRLGPMEDAFRNQCERRVSQSLS